MKTYTYVITIGDFTIGRYYMVCNLLKGMQMGLELGGKYSIRSQGDLKQVVIYTQPAVAKKFKRQFGDEKIEITKNNSLYRLTFSR